MARCEADIAPDQVCLATLRSDGSCPKAAEHLPTGWDEMQPTPSAEELAAGIDAWIEANADGLTPKPRTAEFLIRRTRARCDGCGYIHRVGGPCMTEDEFFAGMYIGG